MASFTVICRCLPSVTVSFRSNNSQIDFMLKTPPHISIETLQTVLGIVMLKNQETLAFMLKNWVGKFQKI